MENAQKAIIMGASALLFVISLSVSVYMYGSVTDTIDSILTSSENNAMAAEYFIVREEDTSRTVSKAEVVMAILDLYNSNGYTYDVIEVDGKEFKKGIDYSQGIELNKIVNNGVKNYIILSESYNANSIKYGSEG